MDCPSPAGAVPALDEEGYIQEIERPDGGPRKKELIAPPVVSLGQGPETDRIRRIRGGLVQGIAVVAAVIVSQGAEEAEDRGAQKKDALDRPAH